MSLSACWISSSSWPSCRWPLPLGCVSAVIITHRLLRIVGCRHHLCLVAHLCLAVRLCSFRFKGSWVPVSGCFAPCVARTLVSRFVTCASLLLSRAVSATNPLTLLLLLRERHLLLHPPPQRVSHAVPRCDSSSAGSTVSLLHLHTATCRPARSLSLQV